ncbi:MAG: signal recognition particle protein Srp54 [Methanobacterium sp.]|jgi:signal recognition particle subunit SRP54|uniref:Signal recognition particle 54 kDa protein n=1 Tax=Methanobacterium subterraneum TaxID=59277 RepID=A0A2H4VRP0_9EURY|nr:MULTISPECIES: signal recognition particle protein Srp54 [Methanobacterium]AUB57639.1 signal recognition particle protein Srp19 [Methanobacterium sp. MZ-A1]AUB60769.1 signal recognition particle protein Srp19 [Methanobacterium subterraneum]MBW4256202.1 signal recognition particle protein Srp54 [Methanobacterium sp. YSL]MCC7559781.1 signal recognition particle protein Srp54 [Methanobacterium sp.]
MLGNLGKNLTKTMKKLAGMTIIDEEVVKEVIKDIQRALIQSDVNIKLVLNLSKTIEDRALNEEPPKGVTAKEHVIKIVYDELVHLLGDKAKEVEIDKKPYKILFVGLQGSGKTTTIGKMGRYLQKKGFNPAIICTDTWRPAAYEQLRQLTESLNLSLYGDPDNQDALDLARKGLNEFKKQDLIIVDTAGRHKEEKDLLDEMEQISAVVEPDEVMLVIDGTIGQQAREQALAFSKTTKIGSIVITKLDGSAKGGGALSAVSEIGAPIKFIGTGEKIEDLEAFDPERFISRLLGMGDIKSLIERAEEIAEEDVDAEAMDAMLSGKFTLKDMYSQFEMMNKMGPMQQVMNLLPGMGNKLPKNASQVTEEKLGKYKILMDSMTEEELAHPEIIKQSRVKRIARGAGMRNEDVKELLKYYQVTKKAIKGFGKRKMNGPLGQMMRQMMR